MRRSIVGGLLVGILVGLVSCLGFVGNAVADEFPTTDGLFQGGGPIGAQATVNLTVVGRGGVPPSGVGSVALNVTATSPTSDGFLTIWPAGGARPAASNVNFRPRQTVPNMVISAVGSGGQISIYNSGGTTNVIVDVLGYFPSGSSFTGLIPARLMDTRPGFVTVDGAFAGGGPLGLGDTRSVLVAGRGGVPAAGVGSVALNVTATNTTAASFVTVWPSDVNRPTASNLNFVAGETRPNMVMVPLSADGRVSIFNSNGNADIVVDVLGWFPPVSAGGSFGGLVPARLFDSRSGFPTVDGAFAGAGSLGQFGEVSVPVTGRGGVPATGVGSVALNVTATDPTAASFAVVWPTGSARPTASNLNFEPGQTTPNMVIVPVGAGGQVSIYNNAGSTNLIVDVLGWFPAGPGFTGLVPARLMDTRVPPPPIVRFEPGQYVVNTQIAPGRYVAEQAISGCSWARQSGLGGTAGEILADHAQNFAGRVIVDILSTDVAFEFSARCGTLTTYVPAEVLAATFLPGAQVVGLDILPGTYTALVENGCTWQRLTSFTGSPAAIIASDSVSITMSILVTISGSDVGFYADGHCGRWVRLN